MSPARLAQLMEKYREIEARGWPTYADNPARCIECAAEFLTRRDELLREEKETKQCQTYSA
jgi:hypothetical protein